VDVQWLTIHLQYRRIDRPSERQDILGLILERREKEEMVPDVEIAAHGSDFVIAGTETTGTALCAAIYYSYHDKYDAFQKLVDEIRGSFETYDAITADAVADLPWLNAVLNEALRLYPPVPWAPTRIVPPGGATVDGHWLPAGVS
jgi:cytochrome P450